MAEKPPSAAITFGKRVRAMREDMGMPRQAFAEASGLSIGTIENVELGKVKHPNHNTLSGLALAFGVKLEEISALLGRPSLNEALADSDLDELAKRLAERLGPDLVAEIRRLTDS